METGVQIVEIIIEFCHIGRRQTEFSGTDCVDRVAANLQVGAHELLSVGHTVLRGTVFGRPLIGANPLAVVHTRVLLEAFHPEFSRTPNGGESALEVILVEGVAIVVPQVGAIPGVGHGVLRSPSRHTAEDATFGVNRPALRLSRALGRGHPSVGFRVVDDEVEERFVAFAEVGLLNGPVVHLDVDVRMHIRVPRRIGAVVPDTLQVVGHVLCTAARRDTEIASEVEIEFFEEEAVG